MARVSRGLAALAVAVALTARNTVATIQNYSGWIQNLDRGIDAQLAAS